MKKNEIREIIQMALYNINIDLDNFYEKATHGHATELDYVLLNENLQTLYILKELEMKYK